jgi:hypothetical protein
MSARTNASSKSLSELQHLFEDSFDFQDDVLGVVRLSEIEKNLVDTPEFQRLFRVSQLGLVDLVYQCANHTRGIHSIGCCSWAKKLICRLNENSVRRPRKWHQLKISSAEAAVISISALLHDISHGPYAHDIEKKSHEIYPYGEKIRIKSGYGPYEKHDDYVKNPVLYITLLDTDTSIVARVLRKHSPEFWDLLCMEAGSHSYPQLSRFVKELKNCNWPELAFEILPQLIFHILTFEKFDDATRDYRIYLSKSFNQTEELEWGLGPDSAAWKNLHDLWYEPYRHDIIGDTLSADLLDYLQRDLGRLGIKKGPDLRLLDSYVMTRVTLEGKIDHTPHEPDPEELLIPPPKQSWYRCAIDLEHPKRGVVRMERLNDLFRLLDLRHEIHEKAVFHRVVQSGAAGKRFHISVVLGKLSNNL